MLTPGEGTSGLWEVWKEEARNDLCLSEPPWQYVFTRVVQLSPRDFNVTITGIQGPGLNGSNM